MAQLQTKRDPDSKGMQTIWVECDFGDVILVPENCKNVHVRIDVTDLVASTLTPQVSEDAAFTLPVPVEAVVSSHDYTAADSTGPLQDCYIIPGGCYFRMYSSETQTDTWFVRCTE